MLQVAVGQGGIVVFRVRAVGDDPGRARRRVAHDAQIERLQSRRTEQRGLAVLLGEIVAEEPRQLERAVLGAKTRQPRFVAEDLVRLLQIEFFQRRDARAPRQARRDDRARAGPADEVKMVGEDEVGAAILLAQQSLHPRKDLQGKNSTRAASVQGENISHGHKGVRAAEFYLSFTKEYHSSTSLSSTFSVLFTT